MDTMHRITSYFLRNFLQSSIVYRSILRHAETTFASYLSFACEERLKMFPEVHFIVFTLYLFNAQVTPTMADGNGC